MTKSLALVVPISTEILEDAEPVKWVMGWLAHRILMNLTAAEFSEDWSGAEEEHERLELGQVISWDTLIGEDDDEW